MVYDIVKAFAPLWADVIFLTVYGIAISLCEK